MSSDRISTGNLIDISPSRIDHLEEVRRMPLTPPKQDIATETGIMKAMTP